MPSFGTKSRNKLDTCDERLQELFNLVVAKYDCTVLEGHRSIERQAELYASGRSKVKLGKHNAYPSLAIDIAPYPIPDEWGENNFKERAKFYHFAGFVQAAAEITGIEIRFGGDWNSDHDFDDQSFDDLVHFELVVKD